jgi:hypothetical protein
VIERGAPLGYLEEQLKLRFGTAQPQAVATVVAAARADHTGPLDRQAGNAGPSQRLAPATQTGWERVKHELSDLFVVRRETATPRPNHG